jgi:hypothetical protein
MMLVRWIVQRRAAVSGAYSWRPLTVLLFVVKKRTGLSNRYYGRTITEVISAEFCTIVSGKRRIKGPPGNILSYS